MVVLSYPFVLTIWFGGPLGKSYWEGSGWQEYTANKAYPFDWAHLKSNTAACRKVFGDIELQKVEGFVMQLLKITAGTITPAQGKDKGKGNNRKKRVDEDDEDEDGELGVPGESFVNHSAGIDFMRASDGDQFDEGRSCINKYWGNLFRQCGPFGPKLIMLVDQFGFHPRKIIGNELRYKAKDFPKRLAESAETPSARGGLMASLFGSETRQNTLSKSSGPHKWADDVYRRLVNNAWNTMRNAFTRDLKTLDRHMLQVELLATVCSKKLERSQNDPEAVLDVKPMQELVSAYKGATKILEEWNLQKHAGWHKEYVKVFQLASRSLAPAAASIEAESSDEKEMDEVELMLCD